MNTCFKPWGCWGHRVLALLIAACCLLGAPGAWAAPEAEADDDNLALMERSSAVDLGRVWHQSENGWTGTWTRRGSSNTFDAVWTKGGGRVTAVLTMKLLPGGRVTILRRDTSDSTVVDYSATIGANGRVTGTGKVRNGIGPYPWEARIEGARAAPEPTKPRPPVATPPAHQPPAATPGPAPSGAVLGQVWHEHENGWTGTWTRRGSSKTFDAVWTKGGARVEAVLTISLGSGNQVSIHRRNSSDGVQVDYTGTLGPNGQVEGTGRIVGSGSSFAWTATIDRSGSSSAPAAAAPDLGRAWHEQENGWTGTWKRRAGTNQFDAVWTKDGARVTAVLTMTLRSGGRVSIDRRDTSDSTQVDYEGTISNGRVQGTGRIRGSGWSFPWSATIDD